MELKNFFLRKRKQEYGFIAPKFSVDDYTFGDGKLVDEVLRPDGQWGDFLSAFEAQSQNGFDTMNCWNFSTQKAIKTIGIYKGYWDPNTDYSERYICVLGEGTPTGGMPNKACYAIYKYGLIPEASLPFSDHINSWWEWCLPNPMTQKYLDEGKKWLDQYDFGYDYVRTTYGKWVWRTIKGFFTGNKMSASQQEIIKDALRYSPLGVSVCAWKTRNGLAYKNSWDRDNHWIQMYGYVDGKYWLLYDNYNNMYIKAEWNYPFGFIMRFSLKKKSQDEIDIINNQNNMTEGQRLLEKLKGNYIIRAEAKGELYLVAEKQLVFCALYISDKGLKDEFNKYLRAKKNFIGISEKDFSNLSLYIELIGGSVDKPINIEDILKNNS